MPKIPRDVSHDTLVAFLARRGWTIHAGKRHSVATKADAQVAIPRHARLKVGTVTAILRVAGISHDEAVEGL